MSVGDVITFKAEPFEAKNKFSSKTLDNRAGVAVDRYNGQPYPIEP